MGKFFLGLSTDQWIDLSISISIILFVVIFGRWIIRFIVEKPLTRLTQKTNTVLDDFIVEIIQLPLYLLLVLLVLDIGIGRLDFVFEEHTNLINECFFVAYLLVGFVLSIRFVQKIIIWYGQEMSIRTETDLDEQLLPFIRRVAMIILWLIGIIILLSHFNVDVSGLVATL